MEAEMEERRRPWRGRNVLAPGKMCEGPEAESVQRNIPALQTKELPEHRLHRQLHQPALHRVQVYAEHHDYSDWMQHCFYFPQKSFYGSDALSLPPAQRQAIHSGVPWGSHSLLDSILAERSGHQDGLEPGREWHGGMGHQKILAQHLFQERRWDGRVP